MTERRTNTFAMSQISSSKYSKSTLLKGTLAPELSQQLFVYRNERYSEFLAKNIPAPKSALPRGSLAAGIQTAVCLQKKDEFWHFLDFLLEIGGQLCPISARMELTK